MKNFFRLLCAIIFFALVINSFFGCGSKTSAIDGSWSGDSGTYYFDKGEYTYSDSNGPVAKGTYTINGSTLSSKVTGLHGWWLDVMILPFFEEDWYSRKDLVDQISRALDEGHIDDDNAEIISAFMDQMFEQVKTTFSITGNTLTITYNTGEVFTFTKF